MASRFQVADGNVRKESAFHKSSAHVCISAQLFESNFNLATGFKRPCQSSQAVSSTYRCEGLNKQEQMFDPDSLSKSQQLLHTWRHLVHTPLLSDTPSAHKRTHKNLWKAFIEVFLSKSQLI